ncbi:conjugal transfer protein MobA [Limibacterium fermenti]|uniref:conjugal transfer protein MobA n=1 Tax=Limibacterium fermenti TaxID=3229863 RepID=UPI003A6FEF2D
MNESKETRKRGKGGRPPKNDPAENCLMVRFTDAEYAKFLTMYEQSGIRSKARFILARIFGEALRVIKTDSSALDFVMKLSALYGQIRSVGVNYNQVVKQLHTTFGEKKALAMLYKLEQETIELSKIGHEVLQLCERFKEEYLSE